MRESKIAIMQESKSWLYIIFVFFQSKSCGRERTASFTKQDVCFISLLRMSLVLYKRGNMLHLHIAMSNRCSSFLTEFCNMKTEQWVVWFSELSCLALHVARRFCIPKATRNSIGVVGSHYSRSGARKAAKKTPVYGALALKDQAKEEQSS